MMTEEEAMEASQNKVITEIKHVPLLVLYILETYELKWTNKTGITIIVAK